MAGDARSTPGTDGVGTRRLSGLADSVLVAVKHAGSPWPILPQNLTNERLTALAAERCTLVVPRTKNETNVC